MSSSNTPKFLKRASEERAANGANGVKNSSSSENPESAPIIVEKVSEDEKRKSYGTSSAGGDWASQATSATTGHMPLSPSTKGTSIATQDSNDRSRTPTGTSQLASSTPQITPSTSSAAEDPPEERLKSGSLRGLKKKPSRYVINMSHAP